MIAFEGFFALFGLVAEAAELGGLFGDGEGAGEGGGALRWGVGREEVDDAEGGKMTGGAGKVSVMGSGSNGLPS